MRRCAVGSKSVRSDECRGDADGTEVYGDRITHLSAVPAGNSDAYREPDLPTGLQHHRVASTQSVERQLQPTESIAFVRVGTRQIDHEISACGTQYARKVFIEEFQIRSVAGAIRQFDVERTRYLVKREVLRAVHAEGEYGIIGRKAGVRSVPLMHVEIDDHRTTDQSQRLQTANGDGDIIKGAEPFATIRKRVMRAAGKIHRDAMCQCGLTGLDRAADDPPRALNERCTPRQPDASLFSGGQRAVRNLLHIRRRVYAQQVLDLHAHRIVEVLASHVTVREYALAQ